MASLYYKKLIFSKVRDAFTNYGVSDFNVAIISLSCAALGFDVNSVWHRRWTNTQLWLLILPLYIRDRKFDEKWISTLSVSPISPRTEKFRPKFFGVSEETDLTQAIKIFEKPFQFWVRKIFTPVVNKILVGALNEQRGGRYLDWSKNLATSGFQ